MIQRKQTLYLAISVILAVICLCFPIGYFISEDMLPDHALYNLWQTTTEGTHDFSTGTLFALLLVTCPITITAIFMYNNRKRQRQLCLINMLCIIIWYTLYIYTGFVADNGDNTQFRITVFAAFPAISFILNIMARKAILDDEKLIKSIDRIR